MPTPSKPIVVLITAFNRQSKLERTLKSLQPELHLLDIVLVDDGSNPPIQLNEFSDYPIYLITLPHNVGAATAANAGLRYIYEKDYEYIARIDSDDVAINGRFTKQINFMREHQDIGVSGSQFHAVNDIGQVVYSSELFESNQSIKQILAISLMLHHPTLIIRTHIAKKTGFYDEKMIAAEDYDFCWRLLKLCKTKNLPEFLINYEIGSIDSLSTGKRKLQAINGLKVKLRYFEKRNPQAYIGIIASVLDIVGVVKYFANFKKYFARFFDSSHFRDTQ